VDQAYFEEVIRPLLRDPLIEFIGEIGEAEKASFLGNARATLFPIDWPEPFGLVMIESMACGTPVIAYRCGSVPEIVEEGVTGYVVDGIDGAVAAVDRAEMLDRAVIRQRFEERFSVERMAKDYLAVYHGLRQIIELPGLGPVPTGIQRPDVTTPAAAGNGLPMPSEIAPS
jgi:glycosyltransferase involved in cell wall biosynthesis